MSFTGFEHKLLKALKEEEVVFGKEVYAACSGGADSIALVYALGKLAKPLKLKVNILHVHHGESQSTQQTEYRDKALSFCKDFAEALGFGFLSEKFEGALESEEECRDFRQSVFVKYEHVFLGHHKDDLTETLVLRLIRGTGLQGLADPFSNKFKKPFLKLFTKAEILNYLKSEGVEYLKDPSNDESKHLRNWVRNIWLKDLEKVRGTNGLSKSLNLISEEARLLKKASAERQDDQINIDESLSKGFFSTKSWLGLTKLQKQSRVAYILLKCQKKSYTSGQINEVVKLLDQSQKRLEFNLAGLSWTKDIENIRFEKQV